MKDNIKEILITTSTHLDLNDINKTKNINGLLAYKLKKTNENVCHKNGFVLKDSLKIVNRSMGKLITHNHKSAIEYNVTMKLNVIYPSPNDIFEVKIDSITKMGIVGFINDEKYDIENSPILFIVPNKYIEDPELLSKDMKINVEVLQSRIKYRSKQIQVVGKLSE
jgi:hypothetical protein